MTEVETMVHANKDSDKQIQFRRKARRAPRERKVFKPYSNLTWQERQALALKDSAQEPTPISSGPALSEEHQEERHGKRRRRRGISREQPPPAPRITTQSILAERLSPKDPPEESECNLEDPCDMSSRSSESSGDFENYFEKAYAECIYDDLQHLNREALIERIRQRDSEIELLRAEIQALSKSVSA
jgi:hypothetical protein